MTHLRTEDCSYYHYLYFPVLMTMKTLFEGIVATWCVDFQCFEIIFFMHYVWIVMYCKFSFCL